MFKKRHLPFTVERDERIKILTERITKTERKLEELSCNFGGLSIKLARWVGWFLSIDNILFCFCRYRDKNDELAKTFNAYSEEEEINQSLSVGMKSFAKSLTMLADFIDLEVHRIEVKVFSLPLSHQESNKSKCVF